MSLGKNVTRIDAYEKVTGRAKYTADMLDKKMLCAKVLHSTFACGQVLSIDTSAAKALEGIVKIVTCFDVPDINFPTAGHPWSTDPAHQDIADRKLLNTRVRYYGDDIAAVIAQDEIAAERALKLIKVEYQEEKPVLNCEDALNAAKNGAPPLHERFADNVLAHTEIAEDKAFNEATSGTDLIKFEAVYETPPVQHCHIENCLSAAWMENGRLVVLSSTQIPHILRRIVAQALGLPWGKVRVIKPCVGGGFGNKQDALYEPLNAFLSMCIGGRPVKLELSREEVFRNTRVRHGEKITLCGWARPDGRLVARSYKVYSNQGAYASHGHSVTMKGTSVFKQLYHDEKAIKTSAWTIYTNTAVGGAMRGYGTPQAIFAIESHIEDMALKLGIDPIEFRLKNIMPVGYEDPFAKTKLRFDAFGQCIAQCKDYIKWDEKRARYAGQTGSIRRGVGMALFWYNTGVWPISLEISSCRMVLNEDGSVQTQLGETEIGQGADTVFAQMTASTLGLRFEDVHIISTQDTDTTPFGSGAYASRQSYVGGMAVHKTALILKDKILEAAEGYTKLPKETLDIKESQIVLKSGSNKSIVSLEELVTWQLYKMDGTGHITAEASVKASSNAYSFGCSFAEVEVDIPLAKTRLLNIVNAHDCGALLNPRLAEAQVHGGMSMAIGFGLSERLIYDEKTGRLLNGNLLDYKISTILDHPRLEARFVECFEPTSPYGSKALGEPPTVSGAAAIRNAVLNATGVAVNTLPLCPQNLFSAFKAAGLYKK
ncbi:MAG: xanthine dehydrogenase molybdenum-binding subunit XdhA [Spirochaetaceae bacterium]|jgi:xanthine dehydrogenase molybdenum-binding subunit|nr:xanthine dehydrogenase molybdenum-binding subunit XdhA [Spirochaetaceae bacterium]